MLEQNIWSSSSESLYNLSVPLENCDLTEEQIIIKIKIIEMRQI